MQLNMYCRVCVSIFQGEQYGEVCVFGSTLCKYDLRKVDLFVLSWAMVRPLCLGSVSSVVAVCIVFDCCVVLKGVFWLWWCVL